MIIGSLNVALLSGSGGVRFLDGRTDVVAAWSFRQLFSNYHGPLYSPGSIFKWYEQSGKGRDLSQATANAQPVVSMLSNGLLCLTFDGANDYLRTAAFTVAQPLTVYIVYRRVTNGSDPNFAWTFEGITTAHAAMLQRIASPHDVSIIGGSTFMESAGGGPLPTGTRGAVAAVYNSTSSRIEINNGTTITSVADGTAIGTVGLDGFTLGASGALDQFGNIEVQEVIIFNTAHSQAQCQADIAAMRTAWRS